MSNFISIYDNVLEKKYCNHLIEKFEFYKEQQKKIEKDNCFSFTEINMNQHNNWKDYVKILMSQVYKKYIEKYISDHNIDLEKQWPQKYAYEEIRFKKYELNSKDDFKEHVDVYDYPSAKRFLVFFLYLNDNDGGETIFPEFNIKVQPKAGKMLMFPPQWTHKHRAEKPKSQPKYILGSYLHYV
jgi:hypothetical protein